MVRFFEKQDKEELYELAKDFPVNPYNRKDFYSFFDDVTNSKINRFGISVLHAGEYLGYCIGHIEGKSVVVTQLYIKPSFQKLKVAPQVLDFIKSEFKDYKYTAACPQDNSVAIKVFERNGFDVILL